MFPAIQTISVFSLLLLFVGQVLRSRNEIAARFPRLVKIVVAVTVVVIGAVLVYDSYLQFSAWRNNDLGRFFLPPHRSSIYFIVYVLARYWGQFLISGIIGLLLFLATKFLNKRRGESLFYPEELIIIGFVVFLTGHPLWIVYLFSAIILYLISSIIFNLWYRGRNRLSEAVQGSSPRFSFYYGWIPLAILFIIFKGAIVSLKVVSSLVIASAYFIL